MILYNTACCYYRFLASVGQVWTISRIGSANLRRSDQRDAQSKVKNHKSSRRIQTLQDVSSIIIQVQLRLRYLQKYIYILYYMDGIFFFFLVIILVSYFLLSRDDLRYEFLIKTYIQLKMGLYSVRWFWAFPQCEIIDIIIQGVPERMNRLLAFTFSNRKQSCLQFYSCLRRSYIIELQN